MPYNLDRRRACRSGGARYVPVAVDRRRAERGPLTDEARAWLDELAADPDRIQCWVRWAVPPGLVRLAGIGECVSEAWVLLLDSARIYRGERGITRTSFALGALRRYLAVHIRRSLPAPTVWSQIPESPTGDPLDEDLPDARTADRDPLLAAWCDEDAVRQRRALSWEARLYLYLRYVECLTLAQIGALWGCTRERVRQIEARAVAYLAERRSARA